MKQTQVLLLLWVALILGVRAEGSRRFTKPAKPTQAPRKLQQNPTRSPASYNLGGNRTSGQNLSGGKAEGKNISGFKTPGKNLDDKNMSR